LLTTKKKSDKLLLDFRSTTGYLAYILDTR